MPKTGIRFSIKIDKDENKDTFFNHHFLQLKMTPWIVLTCMYWEIRDIYMLFVFLEFHFIYFTSSKRARQSRKSYITRNQLANYN